MKLKLEAQDGVTVLVITEEISGQHAAILRAGLTKLFQSGKKSLLLDLTGAQATYAGIAEDLASIQMLAPEFEAQILLASSFEGVSGVASREEGIKQMKSVLFSLLGTEAVLQSKMRKLEAEKAGLETQLMSAASNEAEIKTFRLENSKLRKMTAQLEEFLTQLMANRTEPATDRSGAPKRENLEKTLVAVLEQEGVLPVS